MGAVQRGGKLRLQHIPRYSVLHPFSPEPLFELASPASPRPGRRIESPISGV
jgi:hypothetical protein